MSSLPTVAAEDLDQLAAVQYVALFIVEEFNRRGFIDGHIPKTLMDDSDRGTLRDVLRCISRGIFSWSDTEIESAVMYVLVTLRDRGYDFSVDVEKSLQQIKGVY